MKNLLKDNRGSTLVEAAIYFPIILIMVVGMVVIAMFKIDKMMTQACMSQKATELQSTYDDPNKNGRFTSWIWSDKPEYKDYYMQNSIYTWTSPTEYQAYWCQYETPYWYLSLEYKVNNPRNWFGLISTKTTRSGIITNNPREVAYCQEYMRAICRENILQDKMACTYGQ